MARLLVLRHGKTEFASASGKDFDRALVSRGRENSSAMGELIGRDMPKPEVVLASPATRARQTAEGVLSALDPGGEAVSDDRIYGGSAETLWDVVVDHAGGAPCALIIGHNPGMVDFVQMMVSASDGEDAASATHFPTCALADIGFEAGTLGEAGPGQGKLLSLLRPKQLGFGP